MKKIYGYIDTADYPLNSQEFCFSQFDKKKFYLATLKITQNPNSPNEIDPLSFNSVENLFPFVLQPINLTVLNSMFSPDFGEPDELREFVSNLIKNFFISVDADLVSIEKMFKNQDFDSLRKTFHRLKSTFGTFGLEHSRNLFSIWQKQESFSYNDIELFKMHYSVAHDALTKWINKEYL